MSPTRTVRWAWVRRRSITFAAFWVGGLIALVWLVILTGRVNRAEAERAASKAATINANYASCIRSIPFAKQINGFVAGAETVAYVLLANQISTHEATRPGTEVYRAQVVNIQRLQRAIASGTGVRMPVSTPADCAERRDQALAR